MNRKDKITVGVISFIHIGSLLFENYRVAAVAGFVAIMLLLMGIEEQL